MCRLRSQIETRSMFQLLRDLFRRDTSLREVAEVVPLRETALARHMQAEAADDKDRSEAA